MARLRAAPASMRARPRIALSARRRYLLLTFAFIAATASLILLGWFTVLFVMLIGLMIFAPRVVELVAPARR